MLAYLDTNIFDNLLKKSNGVTDADELGLRATVTSRQLAIVASHINLRETIAALRSRPEIARAQLSLIVSLADWDRFIRFSTNVLEDDIRHFAYNGERANTPFEENRKADRIRLVTQRIIDGDLGLKELHGAIEEDRDHKRAFREGSMKARAETVIALQEFRKTNEVPSFEQFFEDGAEAHALAFVKTFGVAVAEECERRGLDKLLKIPSVRVMVGHGMSLIYRIAVEGKVPKGSDSRDLQHALCAVAAADIFVTHDEELTFLLHRVPIKGFRVLGLHQLLEETTRLRRN